MVMMMMMTSANRSVKVMLVGIDTSLDSMAQVFLLNSMVFDVCLKVSEPRKPCSLF